MNKYVEQRDGRYWISGTQVLLDSVVAAFCHGDSSETIVKEKIPGLTLEQVFGAIAYYHAYRPQIDEYLKQHE